jgi:hypothetical protein
MLHRHGQLQIPSIAPRLRRWPFFKVQLSAKEKRLQQELRVDFSGPEHLNFL